MRAGLGPVPVGAQPDNRPCGNAPAQVRCKFPRVHQTAIHDIVCAIRRVALRKVQARAHEFPEVRY